MEGKIPDEQSNDYARVPLIDLPPTGDDPVQEAGEEGLDTPKSPPPGQSIELEYKMLLALVLSEKFPPPLYISVQICRHSCVSIKSDSLSHDMLASYKFLLLL